MSKSWFEERKCCPACGSEQISIRYQASYSDPKITQYLIDFYSPQGGVEFEYLSDAEYVLCDCESCSLIFQKNIPIFFICYSLINIDYSSYQDNKQNKTNTNSGTTCFP